ncbi:MAG: endolytic transglycosylase MltG [Betaproteobacteria bacterium]|nr:endolytic transglycosylase MltG [Betaproteobacteria bacterium]
MQAKLRRVLIYSLTALMLVTAWLGWFALSPVALPAAAVDFSIKPGSSLKSATRQMIEAGLDMPAWPFNLLVRFFVGDTKIKAGGYQVRAGVTPWNLMRKITLGDFTQVEIVFVEGWTFRQMRAALDAHSELKHDTAALSDDRIMEELGVRDRPPEGLFFPDTYLFGKGESDFAILKRAHREMNKRLQSAWNQRAADLPLANAYEALILASIVEKETGLASDRALVAGVFINRLRSGMNLQTDPSVIYGMGDKFNGNLRKRDLMTDTTYNTYTRAGLPPSPIAMPGQASLLAAVNPAVTGAMYFVARGDGSSVFSRTLEEHNRAVARYQKPGATRP